MRHMFEPSDWDELQVDIDKIYAECNMLVRTLNPEKLNYMVASLSWGPVNVSLPSAPILSRQEILR